jgi:hypothetical protein
MLSKQRIQKINEVTQLLKGEQPDRPPKVWVMVNGESYPTETQPNDIVINVIEKSCNQNQE